MADDDNNNDDTYRPVKSRSDAEIEAIAEACHEAAEATSPMPNIITRIKAAAERFQASRGLKVVVVEDEELPDREAEAYLTPPTIRVRRSVYDAALRGVPRYVMTMAHELGHIVLEHKGHARPRRLNEATRHKAFKVYEDAEHQAKVFAAAFLIPRSLIVPGMSEKEMQMRFGVSEEAACIRHRQLFGPRGRKVPADVKATIDALKRELSATGKPDPANRGHDIEAHILQLWEHLATIPGKDPAVFRKAGDFEVRWSDRHQPRSHYGWRVFHDKIRNYLDLDTR